MLVKAKAAKVINAVLAVLITKILTDAGFENLQTATKGDYTINIRIQKPKGRL